MIRIIVNTVAGEGSSAVWKTFDVTNQQLEDYLKGRTGVHALQFEVREGPQVPAVVEQSLAEKLAAIKKKREDEEKKDKEKKAAEAAAAPKKARLMTRLFGV
jgi:hypothetical protein